MRIWRHEIDIYRKHSDVTPEIEHENWIEVCRNFVWQPKQSKPRSVEDLKDANAVKPRTKNDNVISGRTASRTDTPPSGTVEGYPVKEVHLKLIEETNSWNFRR